MYNDGQFQDSGVYVASLEPTACNHTLWPEHQLLPMDILSPICISIILNHHQVNKSIA